MVPFGDPDACMYMPRNGSLRTAICHVMQKKPRSTDPLDLCVILGGGMSGVCSGHVGLDVWGAGWMKWTRIPRESEVAFYILFHCKLVQNSMQCTKSSINLALPQVYVSFLFGLQFFLAFLFAWISPRKAALFGTCFYYDDCSKHARCFFMLYASPSHKTVMHPPHLQTCPHRNLYSTRLQ